MAKEEGQRTTVTERPQSLLGIGKLAGGALLLRDLFLRRLTLLNRVEVGALKGEGHPWLRERKLPDVMLIVIDANVPSPFDPLLLLQLVVLL